MTRKNIQPRKLAEDNNPVWCVNACTIFLGHYGNWDLYGDPDSGRVITRPVSEGCRSSVHGGRGYFRGTRSRRPNCMVLTAAGEQW